MSKAPMSEDLQGLRDWLRHKAEELIKQADGRKDGARAMLEATDKELAEAHRLAEKSMGRKLRKQSRQESDESARIQRRIARSLEAEARQLTAWADLLG